MSNTIKKIRCFILGHRYRTLKTIDISDIKNEGTKNRFYDVLKCEDCNNFRVIFSCLPRLTNQHKK